MESTKIVNPVKLGQTTVKLLTERLKDEYTAHYYYRNAANWCNNANYMKAAKFFEDEASSELEHAKSLQDYITSWNLLPSIPTVTPDKPDFSNLVDIINGAYKMEYNLMIDYNESSAKLFTSDLTTFDFLSKYREIQKDAVVEYSYLLNALNLIDSNNKFEVLYFEGKYFK